MPWKTKDGKTSAPSGGRGTTNLAGAGVVPTEGASRRAAKAKLDAMPREARRAFISNALWGDGSDD